MQRYVAGLLFDEERKRVVLVQKTRGPKCLHGKWNAVGGKIEADELSSDAMHREFIEETGYQWAGWSRFLLLQGHDWSVDFFSAFDTKALECVRTQEAEIIGVAKLEHLDPKYLVSNLRWIIPMALSHTEQHVTLYTVNETETFIAV